jgi:hypothetical protein
MEGLLANLQWLRMTEQNAQLPIDLTDLTALFDFWQSGSPEGQKTNVLISEISETRANDATDAKVG